VDIFTVTGFILILVAQRAVESGFMLDSLTLFIRFLVTHEEINSCFAKLFFLSESNLRHNFYATISLKIVHTVRAVALKRSFIASYRACKKLKS